MADANGAFTNGRYRDIVPPTSSSGDGVIYDPEMVNHVNLTNPEELEAHLQVLDVRVRLRARRRRAIRLFSVALLVVVAALLVGVGLMSSTNKTGGTDESGGSGGTLEKSGATLPSPPADLASKCSVTSLNTPNGVTICEAACEIADCCNVPQGFALSCADAVNEFICGQYQRHCNVLNNIQNDPSNTTEGVRPETSPGSDPSAGGGGGTPGDVSVPTNPPANKATSKKQEIEQLCGTELETISPPGADSCESLCGASYCCFNHLCVPPPDMDCLDYSACYVLYADVDETTGQDGNAPDLGDDIHEACAGLLDVNDAATDEACIALCGPGACCFEENLSCGNVDCSMYADCIVLHPSFVSVRKEEVTSACENHNDGGAAGGPTLCEQVCTLHVMQCCFHAGGGCDDAVLLGDSSVYCDVYQACGVLGTDPAALLASHKEELDDACTGGAATRSQCIQLCSSATCCYATAVEDTCANVDSTITCSDYQACDVLYA